MTELTLYGSRLSVPPDVSFEVVPVPSSDFETYHHRLSDYCWRTRYNGWRTLYAWTVGLASTEDITEQVKRGCHV
jgi:hypothetical protein